MLGVWVRLLFSMTVSEGIRRTLRRSSVSLFVASSIDRLWWVTWPLNTGCSIARAPCRWRLNERGIDSANGDRSSSGGVYVCSLAFARMPGESHHWATRFLLRSCLAFRPPVNSLCLLMEKGKVNMMLNVHRNHKAY